MADTVASPHIHIGFGSVYDSSLLNLLRAVATLLDLLIAVAKREPYLCTKGAPLKLYALVVCHVLCSLDFAMYCRVRLLCRRANRLTCL